MRYWNSSTQPRPSAFARCTAASASPRIADPYGLGLTGPLLSWKGVVGNGRHDSGREDQQKANVDDRPRR